MPYLFTFLISLAVVFSSTPFFIKLARKLYFLDYPSVLKIHSKPTPLLGGLAVFIGFLLALFFGLSLLHLPLNLDMVGILIAGSLVVVFGLVDDKIGLSPSYKFLGQIIAAWLFLILSHNASILTGSKWDVLILLLWMVGLMNAVNFLDAMDGLCAGVSFISVSAFFVIALFCHQTSSALVALALMGGLLGFLRYNWSPAKIFLGDAGSMFNGFILACLGILFARENTSYSSLLVPILILSYPIFDISFVTLVRLREGRKVYVGDYNNSPRRIANLGLHNQKVVLWIYLFCFLLGSLGVLVYFFFESPVKMLIAVLAWLILVIFGVHLQRNFVNIREKLLLIFTDIALMNGAFLGFFWVKFNSGIFANLWVVPLSEYVAPIMWITIYWVNLFAILGLYEVPGDSRFGDEVKGITKAVGMGIVIFLILTVDPSYLHIKPWVLLLAYSSGLILALGLGRGLIAFLTRRLNLFEASARRAIILGTGSNAKRLFETLSAEPEHGYRVIGFVKQETQNPDLDLPTSSTESEVKVLGTIGDLDEIARNSRVQDILIAVEPGWNGSLQEIMNSVPNLEVFFKIVPELDDLGRGYQTARLHSGLLLRIFPSHMRSWEWLLKRLFDSLVSLVIVVGLLPVWIMVAVWLRFAFKASPLVKCECVGNMGKRIKLYRFRVSQRKDLDQERGQPSLIPSGWLGAFLRNSHLEKVPIFINILKGEASLVGPEPLPPETFEKLSNNLPLMPKRLNVKPGLISLAKINNGFKGYAQRASDHLRDDLSYMENMSLFLDLKILLRGLISCLKK